MGQNWGWRTLPDSLPPSSSLFVFFFFFFLAEQNSASVEFVAEEWGLQD